MFFFPTCFPFDHPLNHPIFLVQHEKLLPFPPGQPEAKPCWDAGGGRGRETRLLQVGVAGLLRLETQLISPVITMALWVVTIKDGMVYDTVLNHISNSYLKPWVGMGCYGCREPPMMFFSWGVLACRLSFFQNVAPSHPCVRLEGMETNMGCSENWCIFGYLAVQSANVFNVFMIYFATFPNMFPESSLEISWNHTSSQPVRSIIDLDDGKIYRKPLYLMVKTMVSCRFFP